MQKLNRDRNFSAIFFAALFRPSPRILRFPFFSLGRSSFPIRSCLFRAAPFPASHPHPAGLSDLFVLPFLSPFFSRPSSRAYSHLFFAKAPLLRLRFFLRIFLSVSGGFCIRPAYLVRFVFPPGLSLYVRSYPVKDFAVRPPVLPPCPVLRFSRPFRIDSYIFPGPLPAAPDPFPALPTDPWYCFAPLRSPLRPSRGVSLPTPGPGLLLSAVPHGRLHPLRTLFRVRVSSALVRSGVSPSCIRALPPG